MKKLKANYNIFIDQKILKDMKNHVSSCIREDNEKMKILFETQ